MGADRLLKKLFLAVLLLAAGPAASQTGFTTGLILGGALAPEGGRGGNGVPSWCFNANDEAEFRACARPFVVRQVVDAGCGRRRQEEKDFPCSVERHLDLAARGFKKQER